MKTFLVAISVIACVASSICAYPENNNDHHDDGSFKFDYSVHDPHTGDFKQQHEVRNKHFVKGTYSFAEPDGTYRVVEYEAEPHKGFNAVVKRIGKAHHPQVYHHHEEPHHHEEQHHDEHHHNEHHFDEHQHNEHHQAEHHNHDEHHDEHNNAENGEHFGDAKSYIGDTHWGHH